MILHIKKGLALSIALVFMFGAAGLVLAQEDTPTLSDLEEQIQVLLQQITDLQTQLSEVQGAQGELRQELSQVRNEFRSYLRNGVSSEEVSQLQETLALDPSLYPEGLVTGFFGPLTEKAVRKFQAKYGIEQVGAVGPITRAKLNSLFVSGAGASGKIPPGLVKKFGVTDASDENGTTTASSTNNRGVGKITLCHSGKNTLSVGIPATLAHLNHGDSIGACTGGDGNGGNGGNDDGNGDDGNGETDTTAPVISNVLATSNATTTSIEWNTDEGADSKVTYATSTPLATAPGVLSVTDTNSVTLHSLLLVDLTASTTYHYFVESTDSSGNTASSTEQSFATE